MKCKRLILSMIFFALATLCSSSVLAQDKYIKITGDQVNIRIASSTQSSIVSKGRKGDVFELRGEEGEWYKINLFSGEWRYVHKSLAKVMTYDVSLPKLVSIRLQIFRALLRAEDRAQAEADQKYPIADKYGHPFPENVVRNIDYMRLLDDRYKLEVIHKFEVQPPTYRKIIVEGVKKNWL